MSLDSSDTSGRLCVKVCQGRFVCHHENPPSINLAADDLFAQANAAFEREPYRLTDNLTRNRKAQLLEAVPTEVVEVVHVLNSDRDLACAGLGRKVFIEPRLRASTTLAWIHETLRNLIDRIQNAYEDIRR